VPTSKALSTWTLINLHLTSFARFLKLHTCSFPITLLFYFVHRFIVLAFFSLFSHFAPKISISLVSISKTLTTSCFRV
jgi:hypothetical protein